MYFLGSPLLCYNDVGFVKAKRAVSNELQHIPFERLVALVDGRLDSAEHAGISQHLAACRRCAADVAWLGRIGGILRSLAPELQRTGSRMRVRALFRALRKPPARHLQAALRFDSARQGPAIGLRAAESHERQLVYTAETFDVDLRVTQADKGWQLAGQVLGPDTAGFVEAAGDTGTERAPLNESCEFTLPPLSAGVYALTLRLGDVEVRIDQIALPS